MQPVSRLPLGEITPRVVRPDGEAPSETCLPASDLFRVLVLIMVSLLSMSVFILQSLPAQSHPPLPGLAAWSPAGCGDIGMRAIHLAGQSP